MGSVPSPLLGWQGKASGELLTGILSDTKTSCVNYDVLTNNEHCVYKLIVMPNS